MHIQIHQIMEIYDKAESREEFEKLITEKRNEIENDNSHIFEETRQLFEECVPLWDSQDLSDSEKEEKDILVGLMSELLYEKDIMGYI